MTNRISMLHRAIFFIATLCVILPAAPAAAQSSDVVTVGTATGRPGTVVDVPVYVRDVSGTPLGIDQPSGSRIQSFSLKVDYSPTAPVQSVTFTRAGITASLTPAFENNPNSPGSSSLLMSFNEATNLVPFVSNAAAPGNLVGHLLVTLSPSAVPGTTVNLNLDPILTELTDSSGSPVTAETVANTRLTLVNGSLVVASAIPALGEWALVLLAMSLAFVAIRMRM